MPRNGRHGGELGRNATSQTERTTGQWSVEGKNAEVIARRERGFPAVHDLRGTTGFPRYSEPASILGKDLIVTERLFEFGPLRTDEVRFGEPPRLDRRGEFPPRRTR